MKEMLITIDGPAGAGKTTVSRKLADRLNYRYVDTGALYRGVALAALNKGVDASDDEGLAALCADLELRFVNTADGTRLLANEVDISDQIRTMEISMLASTVSARPLVREFLLHQQRRLGKEKRVVFEGRDMGTVVFPEAEAKFFLEASVAERARRRYAELPPGSDLTLEQVTADISRRDDQDRNRSHAPLKPAPGAILIDSTDKSVSAVVEEMLASLKTL
ncbi:MAG: (d)CMP kinase [Desulfosudaceae bacterium]